MKSKHADRELVAAVREALAAVAVPADAEPMQRYMKSEMPYYGVKKPARVAALKPLYRDLAYSWPVLRDTARVMWREATHREERYAALQLLRLRSHANHLVPKALPLCRELVVSGAWWDYVDEIATKLVQPILLSDEPKIAATMRTWSTHEDLWLRRVSILCQLGRKGATDLALLEECMAPSLDSKEFFLRKAIGWALRDLARADPDWVRAYVETHADRLSGLSKREALKHL